MPLEGAFIVPHPPLIVPEIGGGQEKRIKKTIDAYEKISRKISEIKPDTIVLTTPHSIFYSDYIHISPGDGSRGNFREFGEVEVGMKVNYDTEFIKTLSLLAEENNIPAGTLGEKRKSLDHGVMVPLYYVNKYFNDYKLVRISISGLSLIEHYKFGKCIKQAAEKSGKKVVFIASGDLSHALKDEGPYGFKEEGPVFDREITAAMGNGDFLQFLKFDEEFCEAAAECGLRSFVIMAGALDGKNVNADLLSYEGTFGVGYAVASYDIAGDDESRHFDEIYIDNELKRVEALKNEEDDYVKLARHTLESYIINHKKIKKDENINTELLNNKAGVFISLKLDGKLRGCIGTTAPTTDCIADEIIQNAISSGTEDPRFYPVTEEELPRLVYSVDVLGKPEPIASRDDLNPKKYGVIVSKGRRSGLLLPDLEGIDNAEEQVSIALKKAGIGPNESYSMERFEVARHK